MMLDLKRVAVIAAILALALPTAPALAVSRVRVSPDAGDVAQGRYLGSPRAADDHRSPDAQDAEAAAYAEPVAEPSSAGGSGFDWLSAALGAAAGAGVMVVVVALATGGRRLHLSPRSRHA